VHLVVACALMLAGISTVSIAAAQPAGGGSAKDPLKLFEPMYPVFESARCVNCHGVVDPIAGINHDKIEGVPLDVGNMLPGQDGNSACLECHDENAQNSVWRLAPSELSFANKSPLELCKQIRADNGLQSGGAQSFAMFLNHLSNDQLIGMAFEGKRAMTENDPSPPPMDRGQFVSFARRWLQEGKAECGIWNGTISQHIVASGFETWDVTIDIDVKDGEARGQVHGTGHIHQTGQGCFVRDDSLTIDTGNTTVGVDLGVLVNSDLLPTGLPQIPVPANLPPGVPPPPLFGSNNGYQLILRITNVDANDHWEQINQPPSCAHTSGDNPFPFTYGGGVVNKTFDPKDPDHLHDTDVFQGPNGATITTTWDLSRD
jgi:hypothetical protein